MSARRPQIASPVVFVPGDLEHGGVPEHAAIVTGLYPGEADRVDLWVFFRGGSPSARSGTYELGPAHRTGWRWPTPERLRSVA